MCIPRRQEKIHVGCVCDALGMQIVYESADIISYCIFSVVGEKFVCIPVLKVCVAFGEAFPCVHDTNAYIFITWFDYNPSVIFQIAQCRLFL